MNEALQKEIAEDLKIELSVQPTFSEEILENKIKSAIREVMTVRDYQSSGYTDEMIEKDLYRYYSVIRDLALYDFAQIGAPFETSHTENSVSRMWKSRESMLKGVVKLAKVI